MSSSTARPAGVIARYLTVGGATVDLTEESDYSNIAVPTQTVAKCAGCGERHKEDWGWNFWANERDEEQPDSYQRRGEHATPQARRWAQSHAEKCRAVPKANA
jgi:hypothetical protein